MRFSYSLLALLALALVAVPQRAAAQDFTECPDDEDECLVQWANPETGEPIINALRNTIVNDVEGDGNIRPDGRVYKLLRGGFYYNEDHITNTDFHLRIIGQTAEEGEAAGENVCGAGGNEDCGPAIIQRYQREDGTTDGLMMESNGDGNGGFTLMNLWLMGQDNTGVTSAYEPITINSSNSTFLIDNVVFDRNEWHHLGFKQAGNDITVRNSHFRNLAGTTQIWEGRAIRLESGAAAVRFENNSFFNLTSFPFQSEAAPVDFFLFNHNTLVNFGRNFNAGGIWKEAYIANNIMVNPFWQGESEQQYQDRLETWVGDGNEAETLDPYTGVFSIAALPSQFGLETDRRILLANNNAYRAPALDSAYDPLGIRAQPLVSDSTQSFFDLYGGMVMQNNFNQDPAFDNAPTTPAVYDQMDAFLGQWIGEAATPWTYVYWDPTRPEPGTDLHPVSISWPLPEDFSYTNGTLLEAGTDGLPLGDLNWFPAAMDDYLANRDAYVNGLIDLAGGAPEAPAGTIVEQAEGAITLEGAEVVAVDGFTSFFIEGGGSILWEFELPADGVYGLNVLTNMRGETTRGQHVRIDGTGLRNSGTYGEYFFCSVNATDAECDMALAQDTWETVEIRQENLIAEQSEALTLTAGMHTLELAPSWGYQGFSGVEVVDADGNVVVALTPPEATAVGVQESCEAEGFCPSGFQWVDVSAGGSVTWSVEIPEGINSALMRLFYLAPGGASGTVLVDGEARSEVAFAAADGSAAAEVATSRFAVTPGVHEVTLEATSGSVQLDYALVLVYEGAVTSTDRDELPDGYALAQNYPNPFNPATSIRYQLGAPGKVTLTVYDALGRQVTTLVDGTQGAGQHHVTFDGADLASGVYFYRLRTEVGQKVQQMVLLK